MGACSSKPKTTDFEGPTESSKETGAATADRSLEPDATQISQSNEPGKQKVGVADANVEASQKTIEPMSSKDDEPVVKGLSSTEEGVPPGVKYSVKRETHSGTAESGNVDNGIVQKVDEGVGAADTEGVSDKAATVEGGASVDQDKDFEDKAVVLDEAGVGPGDAYVDKGVAAEKGQESGTATTQGEQSENLQDISESPGVRSPIIGVVQPADPVNVDDLSESVDLATLETPTPVDSTGSKSPVEIERGLSTGPSAPEDAASVSPDLHSETPEECREASHDDPKVSPPVASVSDDVVVQENGADDIRGVEEVPASAYAQDVKEKIEPEKVEDAQGDIDERTIESQDVKDKIEPEKVENAQGGIDERTIEPQEETSTKVGEKELPAEVLENEGYAEVVDERQPAEAPNAIESKDAEISFDHHSTGVMPEKATEEQDDHTVEEPVVTTDTQPPTLAVDKPAEDDKPEVSPDEGVAKPNAETEHEELVEKPRIDEAGAIEEKGKKVNAGKQELPVEKERNGSVEGDLAFEDASDVLPKVEPSTIEPGDRHSL